jgi:hypothetical protein
MPESIEPKEKQSSGKTGNGRRRAVIVTAVLVLAVVGVVVVMNRDSLLVHSDVSVPPEDTPAVETNRPPEIVALNVASDRIEPFSMCDIVCDAIDPDGDQLSYTWTASAGEVFGEGPAIEWGSPVAEGLYRVSIAIDDGRGGTAEYSVPLRVKANVPPALASLTADSDWVFAGESIRVACEVSDVDGDEVTLEWTATGGELYGQGNAMVWLAPEEAEVYWLSVVARDSYGGESRRAIPVSVTAGEPPEIVGLFVHGENTDMLKKVGNDWMIYQGRSCSVTCATPDGTGPYTYEWSVDFGTLTAEGDTATWVAPKDRVGATILVVISDEWGNSASASVLINVETCPCSF